MNNELPRSEITKQAICSMGLRYKGNLNYSEVSVNCPYHIDKTPSMFISIDKGVYHCFSCGRSGSIESLYKDIMGISLYKALGINNDPFSNFARNNQVDYSYLDAIRIEGKKVNINIDEDDLYPYDEVPDCISYIRKRGIKLSVANSMGFKFAYDTRINTTRFHDRLIIPIYENGKLVSIEGRRIYNTEDVKVLYPLNGSVDLLYDIDNLDREKTLYACEGLMDLAVLRSCEGFENSTSIFGANVTKRQLYQISQFKSFVYIPDNDQAGDKTVDSLKKSGLTNISILKLPENISGNKVKDIGDLPKIGLNVKYLVDRKWFSYIKKI